MPCKPEQLRTEANRLDRRARELRREAGALERQARDKRLCEGLTKTGRPCRQEALDGRQYCADHDPDLTPDERHGALSPRWTRSRLAMRKGLL